jgi:hypothetical protein
MIRYLFPMDPSLLAGVRVAGWQDVAMPESDLIAGAASARALTQVAALTRWVGAGRRLTQTGRLTMADARELVGLIGTGDEIDPVIGDRVFHTRSSEDLRGVTTVVAWAKAAGLVRVVQGRLVPVKKNARLLDRPLDLWAVMFEAFGQLGTAICPTGWYASLLGPDFTDGIAALLIGIAEAGTMSVEDANERVWSTLIARYRMDDATAEQVRHWRAATHRDLRSAINELIGLGALAEDQAGALRLTPLADQVLRRPYGDVAPGDQVAQIKVALLDTEPPVWRRLLVPATIRLDRLDRVIQAAMGWTNSHLHMFLHAAGRYGIPDPDLPIRDERRATLRDLAGRDGDTFGYEYDLGDSWEHEVLLERVVAAEPGGRYPVCLAGAGACPPEDCGGTPGYAELVETLADPHHPDHEDMLQWLGIDEGSDFDPARFDVTEANRQLDATVRATFGKP